MRPNTSGIPFSFLYLYQIILICLNTEIRTFAYSGIRQDYFEGMTCSSPLGESSVALSRLISVKFCTLFEWITWWLRPCWWANYPVEGIEVSELAYVPCIDSGYSVMFLGASWLSDPGGRYWVPGYIKSSFWASLVRVMIDYSLRCNFFSRVKFSCLVISKCPSTRFFNFLGLRPYSCAPQWRICRQITHDTGGVNTQFCCLIIRILTNILMGSVQDRLWSLPVVTSWVALPALAAVGLLGNSL